MTLDLGERLAMLHFREKVALSEFDDLAGGLRIVLRSRGDSSSRKGELKYAHEIMELLDQKHNGQLKSLAIVGDGAGDARFTLNLRGIAAACGRDINIVGHFFFHPELDEYYGEDGLKFYPEWRALSADLITTHRQQEFTAILVDIDRTAFLPRGLLDEVFQEIKEQAILNYVFSFRRTAASHIDKMRVVRKIVTMSNHLREYVRMGENRLHNNEEVVAFSTLLSAIGCLSERWLEKKFPRFRLLSLVDWVKKNITERSWICGLSDQVSNGAQNWYADLLLDHITEVKNSYYSGEPGDLCVVSEV